MKILKLLGVAILVVGMIVGLCFIGGITPDEPTSGASSRFDYWEGKIVQLCQERNWTSKEFKIIEKGVQNDQERKNIALRERDALEKLLFAQSCSYLLEQVDKLFSSTVYPATEIDRWQGMLDFLVGRKIVYEENGNLNTVEDILKQYRILLGQFSFNKKASYSQPLQVYNAECVEDRRKRIEAGKYYAKYFCHCRAISDKLKNMEYTRKKAEAKYYDDLEKCVEEHYLRTKEDVSSLREDQIDFNSMSSSEEAKSRLRKFVEDYLEKYGTYGN